MQIAALVLGILALLGFLVGLVPCFGWFNWINIPFAIIGLVIGIVSLNTVQPGEDRNAGIAGVICCAIAICIGAVRLVLGLGFM